ncbi:hypothetical protein [Ruegeria sp.]|uniref:hypothetical protein n=1 Tax=Ruegeria sp. TaxID=1879320 RepID=UPI003B008340
MILAAGFAAWAGLEARRVRDAQVSALEGLIRAEAQALHFWLHAAQKAPGFTRPDPGTARALSRSETTKLKQIWRAP